MFHAKTALVLSLPILVHGVAPSKAPPGDEAPRAFDVHVRGFALEGQPLAVEVTAPPATTFVLWVDASAGAFPVPGTTAADGTWSQPLRAPAAGTELRIQGFAADGETDEVALTIDAAYSPRPGDLVVTEIQRGSGAWIEVYNKTDYEIDLRDWTLADEDGDLRVLATVAPARRYVVLDGLALRLDEDQVVLADSHGQMIDRVAYDVAAGWPASEPGVSLQLSPNHLSAIDNDLPSAWTPPSTASASAGALVGSSPGMATPCSRGDAVEDVPDLDYLDTNCDGIDGDESRAVFVATTGLPTNPGTKAQPLNNIQVAIDLAAADPSKDHVYVSEGTYSGAITLANGVSVWGGYSAANGWERSSAHVTTITGAVTTINGTSAVVGIRGANLVAPMTLGSVTVTTPSATANRHNYGVHLLHGHSVRLEAITVLAGNAGLGSNGSAGATGALGSSGAGGDSD
ncbi:MAG TPA: lamin tail domain-containing protein, partial [Planctomycetota bacterium]|nr:lamin tail domain-containing protein [Planctomycetota bacterium]